MVMTMTMMVITRGIISPMRQHHHQQQPQEVQQPKPKELAINPATTSSLMRRRGRMSPMRNMASLSRAGTVSPTKSMLSSDSRSVNSKYNGDPRGSSTRSVNKKTCMAVEGRRRLRRVLWIIRRIILWNLDWDKSRTQSNARACVYYGRRRFL